MGVLFYLIEHIFLLKASYFVPLDLMIIIHPERASVTLCEMLNHFCACRLPCDVNPSLYMMSKAVTAPLVLCVITVTASSRWAVEDLVEFYCKTLC